MRQFILTAVLAVIPTIHAALFRKDGSLVPSDSLFDPEVYWPYLSAKDTRFNGVGLITFNQGAVNCIATLLRTWTSQNASSAVLNQKAIAVTGGSCYNNLESPVDRARFIFDVPPTPGLNVLQFNRTWDNAKNPRNWLNYTIDRVLFSTLNNSDISILRLNVSVGELLQKRLRFYSVAREEPEQGDRLSAIQFFDPILGFALRRAPGRFISDEAVFDENIQETRKALRFTCNWGYVGAPVFDTRYSLQSMATLVDVDFNAGPRLEDLSFCFDRSNGAFDFNNEKCLKEFKKDVEERYDIELKAPTRTNSKENAGNLATSSRLTRRMKDSYFKVVY